MTNTATAPIHETPASAAGTTAGDLHLFRVEYPAGSVSQFIVTGEDLDSELSFYYNLKVTTMMLTAEQTAKVAPILAEISARETALQEGPPPYLRTAADREVAAVKLLALDAVIAEMDDAIDSLGLGLPIN